MFWTLDTGLSTIKTVMAMKTEEFVDLLEQRQLVPVSIVRQLREKISKGDRRITAQSLLKYLVKKELLTHSQAKQLLQSTLTVSPSAESSILGIAELSKTLAEEVVPTLTPVDPASESTNIKETREALKRIKHGKLIE